MDPSDAMQHLGEWDTSNGNNLLDKQRRPYWNCISLKGQGSDLCLALACLLTISKLKCSKIHWQGLVFMECDGNQLLKVGYGEFTCWYLHLFLWRKWIFFIFNLIRSNSWDVICRAFDFWAISLKVYHISCYSAAWSARRRWKKCPVHQNQLLAEDWFYKQTKVYASITYCLL